MTKQIDNQTSALVVVNQKSKPPSRCTAQIVTALKKAEKEFGSRGNLAAFLGLPPSTIGRWINGTRVPGRELMECMDKLGISIAETGFPLAKFATAVIVPKEVLISGQKEGDNIKGIEVIDDFGGLAFPKNLLQEMDITCADKIILFDAVGDSMYPIIKNGDILLVDRSQTTLTDGGIYILAFGEDVMVRRSQRLPNGWALTAENPSFHSINLDHDDLEKIRIIGRIRWFSRTITD